MKMTENSYILSSLYRINRNINKLSEQVSDGKATTKPSDIAYNTRLTAEINEYNIGYKNLNKAKSMFESIDSAMAFSIGLGNQMRDLLIAAQNPSVDDATLQILEDEYEVLAGAFISLVNNHKVNTHNYLGSDFDPLEINLGSGRMVFEPIRIDVGDEWGLISDKSTDDIYIQDPDRAAILQEVVEIYVDFLTEVRSDYNTQAKRLSIHEEYSLSQAEVLTTALKRIESLDNAKINSELTRLKLLEKSNFDLMQYHYDRSQNFLKLLQN